MYRDVFPSGDPVPFAEQMFRVYDTDKNGYIDFRGMHFRFYAVFQPLSETCFRVHDGYWTLGSWHSGAKVEDHFPLVRLRQQRLHLQVGVPRDGCRKCLVT